MRGLNLLLDSSLAKRNPNGRKQVSEDFTIFFDPPIFLDPSKRYKAALDELVSMTYSWYNIAAVYNNNKFKWRKTSDVAWKTVTVPDGMYDYAELSKAIQAETGTVDPNDKTSDPIFTLYLHTTIFQVVILIADGYEIDI